MINRINSSTIFWYMTTTKYVIFILLFPLAFLLYLNSNRLTIKTKSSFRKNWIESILNIPFVVCMHILLAIQEKHVTPNVLDLVMNRKYQNLDITVILVIFNQVHFWELLISYFLCSQQYGLWKDLFLISKTPLKNQYLGLFNLFKFKLKRKKNYCNKIKYSYKYAPLYM